MANMMVRRIAVRGYRSLQDVAVDLGPLNVLIGPNGSGKSSLLDVLYLLSQALDEEKKLGTLLSRRGGLARILTLGRAEQLEIQIEATLSRSKTRATTSLAYDLRITPQGLGFVVAGEHLSKIGPGKKRSSLIQADETLKERLIKLHPNIRPKRSLFDPDELVLAQIPRSSTDTWFFRSKMSAVRLYEPVSVARKSSIRQPQRLEPTSFLVNTGESDLYSVLYGLRLEKPDWYERIEDFLRAGFPGFQKLDFPVVGGGEVTLAWYQDAFGGKPFFANELSPGTLRFLHLATLLLSPELPSIILIDEPETSLHPELLRLLALLLIDAADRSQLLVATQSAALLRWLRPEHIIVVDREDGVCSGLTRGVDLDLEHWIEEYTLEELWNMGQLGGK